MLLSDNGSQFISKEFEDYCVKNGIEHVRTSPFHPMSNGQAERFVDTFKRKLQKLRGKGTTAQILQKFLLTYRSTPNMASPGQRSPAENFLGRPLRTPLSMLTMDKTDRLRQDKKMAMEFNRHHGARMKEFYPEDLVYTRDFRTPNKPQWTAGVVVEKRGRTVYEVMVDNMKWVRHANQLRRRYHKDAATTLFEDFDLPLPPQEQLTPISQTRRSSSEEDTAEDEELPRTPERVQKPPTPIPTRPIRTRNTPSRLVMDPSKKKYDSI